jgi:penicillin-binding protein 1A
LASLRWPLRLLLRWPLRLGVLGGVGAVWLLAGVYLYLAPDLPDVETLRDVRLQTPMRVYSRDGELIGQFGEQKRNPLRYEQVPQQFIQALLAAEDDGFFRHNGIDFAGLLRAVSELLLTGEKVSGGSTLTMQVARNYFLSLERTFMRKFNEILLAIEIERRLSKEEIFELYVNRVFLGHRAYGFEAASQVYYGRSIGELSLAQHAMLAGIPKAPSRNNPLSGPEAGKARRNWILGRMRNLGFIGDDAYLAASGAPVTAEQHGARISLEAPHAAEMARRRMIERYGLSAYTAGYHVYTTVDSRLQRVAQRAVIDGLMTYDGRHGYRGPEQQLAAGDAGDPAVPAQWISALEDSVVVAGLIPALVTAVDETGVDIALQGGQVGRLAWEDGLSEARPYRSENVRGPAPAGPGEVLARGDLIRVQREKTGLKLAQLPDAQAALVSLDPADGAIVSLVGGLGFEVSKFNRATQAQRQPGSNMKPFLYAAALNAGFTAASIINDAPIVMQDASLEGVWRPENDGGKFYGPTRLRWALTRSRNLVSIRLLQQLGVSNFIDYATELGFDTADFAPDLSLALGTQAMSPLELATAYAILANGGYRIEPYLIARIEDLAGEVVFEAQPATVPEAEESRDRAEPELSMEQILRGDQARPDAERVMDKRVNFIIDDMLQDVIKRGTGRRALVLERGDIAGKTGTTNGPVDAWFSGYNPEVVTTTWVGFDDYRPLGRREFGGTAALPIWINFMREALRGRPELPRALPPGVSRVRIDPDSGKLAAAAQGNAIFEYFRNELVPGGSSDASTGQPQGTDELIQEIF